MDIENFPKATFKVCKKPDLANLADLELGTIYFTTDSKKYYLKTDNEVVELANLNSENTAMGLNLYQLNKNMFNQLEPMSKEELYSQTTLDIINEFQERSNNTHYMLLCKDYNYYTIFEHDLLSAAPALALQLTELVAELGDVMSIEAMTDGNIEIWIRPSDMDGESFAFYLFPYDQGVVYYG